MPEKHLCSSSQLEFTSPLISYYSIRRDLDIHVISTIGEISWLYKFASQLLSGQEISPIVEMTESLRRYL